MPVYQVKLTYLITVEGPIDAETDSRGDVRYGIMVIYKGR